MPLTSSFIHDVNASVARKFSIRQAVTSPIKLFKLSDFDIDTDTFLREIGSSFLNLPFDQYDIATAIEKVIKLKLPSVYSLHEKDWVEVWNNIGGYHDDRSHIFLDFWDGIIDNEGILNEIKKIKPFRRRSCFGYLITSGSAKYQWNIEESGVPIFTQSGDDYRARKRIFASPPESVYRNKNVLHLIGIICQLITQNPSVFSKTFKVTIHQMLTYANKLEGNEPAPEGIHQDNTSFIVSAIVIERENVKGGVSNIYYSKNKELAFEHELQPGEGIMQSDEHHNLWHGVTPIYSINKDKIAYRSILGFDIAFLK